MYQMYGTVVYRCKLCRVLGSVWICGVEMGEEAVEHVRTYVVFTPGLSGVESPPTTCRM